MAELRSWAGIWASPLGRGSIGGSDDGLTLDGWDDGGRTQPIVIAWSEIRRVARASSAGRLRGLSTLLIETPTGTRSIAPLEPLALAELERVMRQHLT